MAKEISNEFNRIVADIEDAQTEIRLIVKNAFLTGAARETINVQLERAIEKCAKGIELPQLKRDAVRSLWNFANKQRIIWQSAGISPAVLAVIASAANGKPVDGMIQQLSTTEAGELGAITYEEHSKGVPLREFYGEVWKDKVKPTLDNLCYTNALDPNDFTGRNSLRNLAEMEVRYQDHKDNVDSLKNKGVKLVICSAHADCSDRCKPYQGRIYSLDGSKGTTPDGHHYVPLEEATQNPSDQYTTKAGRVYQNGLLGFNCRHKLYEYKGQAVPTVTESSRKREYEITKKQRELERRVRAAKTESLMYKGISNKYSKLMAKKAKQLYTKYIDFCKANKRAFYPMRVAI